MAKQVPSIPKGTRDFSPEVMLRRNYIFDTIRSVFDKYGFMPLETPSMENLSTLMGKYGEEGDKLLFKILNSGDFMGGISDEDIHNSSSGALAARLCEKGLRYDLTVPFARYVVQHQSEITFPFKRYQIQPVWRADRPQKGRYREFYQCDVDVIGSTSMISELELIQIVDEVFRSLGIRVLLKINNRKILYGIAETIGFADKMIDITVAIDKLDKIGLEAVNAELQERGISAEAVEMLQPILSLEGTNREKLAKIAQIISGSETGLKGVDEMSRVLDYVEAVGVELPIELDLSLARGLNYYTGAIFEVKAFDYQIGSISGGGRYDDLTGIFGLPGMSGVGISFGADRIYDVMLGLDLFPNDAQTTTEVLFVNFGGAEEIESLKVMRTLRERGYKCEIYPEAVKMKKQMDYANRRAIPYVAIIVESERAEGKVVFKRMSDGEQKSYSVDDSLLYYLTLDPYTKF
ncbi:MAG: histidine--tRNA ligase [Rikenellaceae bacterium]|nr:histidine--tRNA ligase [Rikenellaceae bacterium]